MPQQFTQRGPAATWWFGAPPFGLLFGVALLAAWRLIRQLTPGHA